MRFRQKVMNGLFRSPYCRPMQQRRVRMNCDSIPGNGIYDPFFELYIQAVCMQPAYGSQGSPECLDSLTMTIPPVDTQIEIVEAIQMYSYVIDIDPIKGLLVRLMMQNNTQGIQEAMMALSDHYQAIERLQSLFELSDGI